MNLCLQLGRALRRPPQPPSATPFAGAQRPCLAVALAAKAGSVRPTLNPPFMASTHVRWGSITFPRRSARWPASSSVLFALAVVFGLGSGRAQANEIVFEDPFSGQLKAGWSWRRETPGAWHLQDGALHIRIEPGNMWGPANDGRNVLIRDLPAGGGPWQISVTVSNQPTGQYEQADLVAYYDDSHMVKIGFELVDGKRCVVMGREEKDRTRTLAIVPLGAEISEVDLRLAIDGSALRGYYRTRGAKDWSEAGRCDLPGAGPPKVAIQCYQGVPGVEHWARISKFIVTR